MLRLQERTFAADWTSFAGTMRLSLKKEPKNEWDREAIAVYREGLGKVGYVANSPKTVLGESYSAGRLYDKIGKKATARVEVITDKGVLCKVKGPFKD